MPSATLHLRRVRFWLGLFVAGLTLSGLTAFPLVHETALLAELAGPGTWLAARFPALADWLTLVHRGLAESGARYPFLAYGTDWLAFAHLVIALAFLGPLRDPVRNLWVIEWGLIASLLVLPTAALCGALRGIPLGWRAIDASFGVLAAIPLAIARSHTLRLAASEPPPAALATPLTHPRGLS